MTSEEDFRRPAPPPPWLSFSVCPANFHDHDPRIPITPPIIPSFTVPCRSLTGFQATLSSGRIHP